MLMEPDADFKVQSAMLIEALLGLYSSIHSSAGLAAVPAQATSLMIIERSEMIDALASSSSVVELLPGVESGSASSDFHTSAQFVLTPLAVTFAVMFKVWLAPLIRLPAVQMPVLLE